MKYNVVAPSVGESITEVSILKWAKPNGSAVKTGELLLEIESDKATVEIVAEQSGVLTQLKPVGERIPIGEVIGMIDDSATASASASTGAMPAGAPAKTPSLQATPPAAPHSPRAAFAAGGTEVATPGPAARKMAAEMGVSPGQVTGTGKDGRVTKGDLGSYTNGGSSPVPAAPIAARAPQSQILREGDRRVPMSNLRARIAERLVQAQHTAAILTTFNECDMSAVLKIRNEKKEDFKAKYGVSLGFMTFFARASVEALKLVPEVNASLDGRDVIYHDYVDVGIAVGTERGLVVPVVRNADKMSFVDIEKRIAELAIKGRDGKLSITDLSGGTFTISNGGVYGSLMSTPILNPPQSAILGMHKTLERPIALNGKVEIRPMMYLALSYDHRLIDGKGAVTFLVHVRDFIENPDKLKLDF